MRFTFRKRPLQTIGGYELIAKIGEGGMGSVYKARRPDTEELVALKLISASDLQAGTRFQRFEQEYRASMELKHKSIVRGLDFGCEDDIYYFAMELVEGQSLGEVLDNQGRLSEEESVHLIAQAAEALDYAHLMGMVHRDVKPDNLLIDREGRLKLADFGLVKKLSSGLELTMPGKGLGTPNYAAPEQFEDAKTVDLRCDVYSLGATLYSALTGIIPFQARTPIKTLKMKLCCEITPVRMIVPNVNPRLESLIARSLSVEPEGRPASCRDFYESLTGRKKHMSKSVRLVGLDTEKTKRQQSADTPRDGMERRHSTRRPSKREALAYPLPGDHECCWRTKINDVSTEGVSLLLRRRFEPSTPLFLRVQDEEQTFPRWLMVRVVRVEAKSNRRWLLGCTFARQLSVEEARMLE